MSCSFGWSSTQSCGCLLRAPSVHVSLATFIPEPHSQYPRHESYADTVSSCFQSYGLFATSAPSATRTRRYRWCNTLYDDAPIPAATNEPTASQLSSPGIPTTERATMDVPAVADASHLRRAPSIPGTHSIPTAPRWGSEAIQWTTE